MQQCFNLFPCSLCDVHWSREHRFFNTAVLVSATKMEVCRVWESDSFEIYSSLYRPINVLWERGIYLEPRALNTALLETRRCLFWEIMLLKGDLRWYQGRCQNFRLSSFVKTEIQRPLLRYSKSDQLDYRKLRGAYDEIEPGGCCCSIPGWVLKVLFSEMLSSLSVGKGEERMSSLEWSYCLSGTVYARNQFQENTGFTNSL